MTLGCSKSLDLSHLFSQEKNERLVKGSFPNLVDDQAKKDIDSSYAKSTAKRITTH